MGHPSWRDRYHHAPITQHHHHGGRWARGTQQQLHITLQVKCMRVPYLWPGIPVL